MDEDEPISQEETIKVEAAVNQKIFKENLEKALDTLTSREKEVLELRFGLKDGEARTLKGVRKVF